MKKYLIRFDDCHKNQDYIKWDYALNIVNKHKIKPLVAIIPNNRYSKINYSHTEEEEFKKWIDLKEKEIVIAVHGETHLLEPSRESLYKNITQSEFVGKNKHDQRKKIENSLRWFRNKGLNPKWFVAPKHSFDEITIQICSELGINISDGIEFWPFKHPKNLTLLVPQVFNKARVPPFPGLYTFCYHPNSMSLEEFKDLDNFLSRHKKNFIEWTNINSNLIQGNYKRSLWYNKMFKILLHVRYTFFKGN